MRRVASYLMIALLTIGLTNLVFDVQEAKAGTIVVPDNYPTIQAAINAASPGDTVYVKTGTYYENVIVNRTLSLVGENPQNTIIDGGGESTLTIAIDYVSVTGFTMRNGNSGIRIYCANYSSITGNNITANNGSGVSLQATNKWDTVSSSSNHNIIGGNNITNNRHGIGLGSSSGNSISGNNITNNQYGVYLWDSSGNSVSGNNITNNYHGIDLYLSSSNNIFHNNFISNTSQVYSLNSMNVWDDGYPSGGNYWSDYTGVDLHSGPYQNQTGSDVIGDTPYVVDANNQDHYPLTIPFGSNLPLAFPTASFIYTPTDPIAPQPVTFNASSCTCVNGSITRYKWNFGDGTTGAGQTVSHAYGAYGNYNVNLTVISNTFIPSNQEQLVNVRETPTASSFSSPSPAAGHPVTFDASASDPRGGSITAYVWDFGDGNKTSTVDPVINHIYTFPSSFNVTLTVSDSEDLNSSISKATLVMMPTAVSMQTSSSSAAVGFTVSIGGYLTDFYGEPLENEPVVLFYTFPGVTNWYPISSGITNSLGNYYVQWTPQATGYFTIRAEWAGNATHLASNDTVSLSVLPYQNTYAFSVESNSTVSGLTFDTNSQTLNFHVTGTSGTEGYARVTIAKALVPDITQLEVRLDGVDYNYSAVSLDDSWLLTFTYNHSIHQVNVYLDKSIIPEFPTFPVMLLFMATVLLLTCAAARRKIPKRSPLHDQGSTDYARFRLVPKEGKPEDSGLKRTGFSLSPTGFFWKLNSRDPV